MEKAPTSEEHSPQSTDGETEETLGGAKPSQVKDIVCILLTNRHRHTHYTFGLFFFTHYAAQGEKLEGLLKEEELHGMPETTEFQNRWEVNLEGESPHV